MYVYNQEKHLIGFESSSTQRMTAPHCTTTLAEPLIQMALEITHN